MGEFLNRGVDASIIEGPIRTTPDFLRDRREEVIFQHAPSADVDSTVKRGGGGEWRKRYHPGMTREEKLEANRERVGITYIVRITRDYITSDLPPMMTSVFLQTSQETLSTDLEILLERINFRGRLKRVTEIYLPIALSKKMERKFNEKAKQRGVRISTVEWEETREDYQWSWDFLTGQWINSKDRNAVSVARCRPEEIGIEKSSLYKEKSPARRSRKFRREIMPLLNDPEHPEREEAFNLMLGLDYSEAIAFNKYYYTAFWITPKGIARDLQMTIHEFKKAVAVMSHFLGKPTKDAVIQKASERLNERLSRDIELGYQSRIGVDDKEGIRRPKGLDPRLREKRMGLENIRIGHPAVYSRVRESLTRGQRLILDLALMPGKTEGKPRKLKRIGTYKRVRFHDGALFPPVSRQRISSILKRTVRKFYDGLDKSD